MAAVMKDVILKAVHTLWRARTDNMKGRCKARDVFAGAVAGNSVLNASRRRGRELTARNYHGTLTIRSFVIA